MTLTGALELKLGGAPAGCVCMCSCVIVIDLEVGQNLLRPARQPRRACSTSTATSARQGPAGPPGRASPGFGRALDGLGRPRQGLSGRQGRALLVLGKAREGLAAPRQGLRGLGRERESLAGPRQGPVGPRRASTGHGRASPRPWMAPVGFFVHCFGLCQDCRVFSGDVKN